jgi:hypothetical protein
MKKKMQKPVNVIAPICNKYKWQITL